MTTPDENPIFVTLNEVFASKTRRKIIAAMMTEPRAIFTNRQLADALGRERTTIETHTRALAENYVIDIHRYTNGTYHYQISPAFAINLTRALFPAELAKQALNDDTDAETAI